MSHFEFSIRPHWVDPDIARVSHCVDVDGGRQVGAGRRRAGVCRSQIYTMKLATSLNGHSYRFSGVTEVLAKASEPKSGERLIGIAAETATERLAAKVVLLELTVGDLTENPTVPYEQDEVTRVNWEGVNQPGYKSITMDDQDVELSAAVVPATQRAHFCVSGRTMRRPKMPSSPTWIRHYSRS